MLDDPTVLGALAVNFITVIGGLSKGISVLVGIRDEMRDLVRAVGSVHPPDGPSGLLGDMDGVKREIRHHRDSLIEVTAELGLKRPGGRT